MRGKAQLSQFLFKIEMIQVGNLSVFLAMIPLIFLILILSTRQLTFLFLVMILLVTSYEFICLITLYFLNIGSCFISCNFDMYDLVQYHGFGQINFRKHKSLGIWTFCLVLYSVFLQECHNFRRFVSRFEFWILHYKFHCCY